MSEATGHSRLRDALVRLGEPEGERGLVPFWEGRVFTRGGLLRATSSDEQVLAVLSGMTYGRGPFGVPAGELAGLRKGVAAGRLRLPGRSVARSLELVDRMIRISEILSDGEDAEARRVGNRRLLLAVLSVGALALVCGMWLMLPALMSILPG